MATPGSTSRLSLLNRRARPFAFATLSTLATIGLLALVACTNGATPDCTGDAGCGTDTFDAAVSDAADGGAKTDSHTPDATSDAPSADAATQG
jgi:hypothetical protein